MRLSRIDKNCLEGSTERSDSNRGRSPRKTQSTKICLEGSTPVIWQIPMA